MASTNRTPPPTRWCRIDDQIHRVARVQLQVRLRQHRAIEAGVAVNVGCLHIPLDIELYDSEGNVIALQKGGLPVNNVLNVTEAEQTFVFDGVAHKPVPTSIPSFFFHIEATAMAIFWWLSEVLYSSVSFSGLFGP